MTLENLRSNMNSKEVVEPLATHKVHFYPSNEETVLKFPHEQI